MFNPFKKSKTFKRIKNLWRYGWLLQNSHIGLFETNRFHILDGKGGFYLYEFKSNLGIVHVEITEIDSQELRLSYSNYCGATVFNINAYMWYSPDIEPMLGEDITAENINLALLELESYLESTYGDIETLWRDYEMYKKYQKRLHMEQVHELEH